MEGILLKEKWDLINDAWGAVLSHMPPSLLREIMHIGASRKGFPIGLCEIRLRASGACTLVFEGECIRLMSRVGERELSLILDGITDGSLYAFRDTLADGFVPLRGGVRVGVCGVAKYDGGELVGIHGISSMVFRLPFGECNFADELAKLFSTKAKSGMLIYAPPGGGKTTALRSIVKILSSGEGAKRVCVVDERCEFLPQEYLRCEADILRGYKRSDGIEIAVRTLNPEIIVIDEIGAKDAAGLYAVMRCGIPIVATAHASSLEEVRSKPSISLIAKSGVFDLFVGIVKNNGVYGIVSDSMPVGERDG